MKRLDVADVARLGEPLVDARAVAAFLGIHVSGVYRLAGAPRGIPVVEVSRGVRRFRPADVRAFVEARTAGPQMAAEARNLLDSIATSSAEEPRFRGRTERQSCVARGGRIPAPAGGP